MVLSFASQKTDEINSSNAESGIAYELLEEKQLKVNSI